LQQIHAAHRELTRFVFEVRALACLAGGRKAKYFARVHRLGHLENVGRYRHRPIRRNDARAIGMIGHYANQHRILKRAGRARTQ
jgi:hypothetical protein